MAALEFSFADPRYRELLFRYRARNWPESFGSADQTRWNDYRRLRLASERGLSEYDFTGYYAAIAALRDNHGPGREQTLLDALQAWGKDIEASL